MGPAKFMVLFLALFNLLDGSQSYTTNQTSVSDNFTNTISILIAMCVLLVRCSLVGSCGVGGSGDLVSRRGAGGVLPPHHPHPHPADFPHPLRFNCMDICSSFATVGSLSKSS